MTRLNTFARRVLPSAERSRAVTLVIVGYGAGIAATAVTFDRWNAIAWLVGGLLIRATAGLALLRSWRRQRVELADVHRRFDAYRHADTRADLDLVASLPRNGGLTATQIGDDLDPPEFVNGHDDRATA